MRKATGLSLLLVLLLGCAAAQHPPSGPGAPTSADEQSGEVRTLALASLGVYGGLPSYQNIALGLSVQYRYAGLAVQAGYGGDGPAGALALRGYPPLPIPLPLYLGAGAAVGGDGLALFGAVGAHVHMDGNWRLDLEGGAVRLSGTASGAAWRPHLRAGISYAFSFDPAEAQDGASAGFAFEGPEPAACASPPDEAGLRAAFRAAVEEVLEDLQAAYGAQYTDLSYDYRITDIDISGSRGRVEADYSGSAREVATGLRESAEGEARATFAWRGCRWRRTSVHY